MKINFNWFERACSPPFLVVVASARGRVRGRGRGRGRRRLSTDHKSSRWLLESARSRTQLHVRFAALGGYTF
jgi:hypothetical protein